MNTCKKCGIKLDEPVIFAEATEFEREITDYCGDCLNNPSWEVEIL